MVQNCDPSDPRVLRSRELLRQALRKLLEEKEFEEISVNDVALAATLNRATFYDHFADKFALLECMVGGDFHDLLASRKVQFDGSCSSGLKSIVLAVCDYLVRMKGPDCQRPSQPHMEAAIIAVVRRILVEGLKKQSMSKAIPAEMTAAAASWAIYGAVKEWAQTPGHGPPDEIAETVASLVLPIFGQTHMPEKQVQQKHHRQETGRKKRAR